MTVGDLRDLEDDDWTGMGLTVFACRALRNALTGRSRPAASNASSASSQPLKTSVLSSSGGDDDNMQQDSKQAPQPLPAQSEDQGLNA